MFLCDICWMADMENFSECDKINPVRKNTLNISESFVNVDRQRTGSHTVIG